MRLITLLLIVTTALVLWPNIGHYTNIDTVKNGTCSK